jgi:hypothetical protein
MNPVEQLKFECLRLALQNGPCDAIVVAEEYFKFVSGQKAETKKTLRRSKAKMKR